MMNKPRIYFRNGEWHVVCDDSPITLNWIKAADWVGKRNRFIWGYDV